MKLTRAAEALVLSVLVDPVYTYGSHWEAEYYEDAKAGLTTNAMWVFGQDGIHVFSPNGEEMLVRHKEETACHAIEDPDAPPNTIRDDCWHMDPVHDGENYVFVGNNDWVERGYVDVYSMWTGRKMSNIPVCSLPYHMEYSPNRRELWVSCWLRPIDANGSNETDRGTIEVIQTQALGAIPTAINTPRGYDAHHHNNFVIDISIPDQAYELSMEHDKIYAIDANSKQVVDTLQIQDTVGTYEYAYSPVNRHMYLRTYACCACGEFKDTREACASWMEDPQSFVNVTSGPNASPDPQAGNCGKGCRGSLADVNGLWEFDTQTNKHVAQHFPANGAHGAKPFATPLGDFILIGSGDGGNAVKVLKPGRNGEASTDVGIINLDFGADVGNHAFSDVAFIEGDGKNIVVFSSTLNNHLVLVDMSDFKTATEQEKATVAGIDLELFKEELEEISAVHDPRGINIRQISWAMGTNYVWVSSPATNQVHVIELGATLKDAKVLRTLDDIEMTRHFLYVHSFQEDALLAQQEEAKASSQLVDNRVDDVDNATDTATILGVVGVALGGLALLLSLYTAHTSQNNRSEIDPMITSSGNASSTRSKEGGSSSGIPSHQDSDQFA